VGCCLDSILDSVRNSAGTDDVRMGGFTGLRLPFVVGVEVVGGGFFCCCAAGCSVVGLALPGDTDMERLLPSSNNSALANQSPGEGEARKTEEIYLTRSSSSCVQSPSSGALH